MAVPVGYSIRSIAVRWRDTLFAVAGVALVVGVFVALPSMASGISVALRSSGTPGNAIVLEKGALSELGSSFSKAAGDSVANDPRVAHDAAGGALASPELVAVVALPERADGSLTNVGVRGVTPAAYRLRTGVTLLQGRHPSPGLFEIMVGRALQQRIRGLDAGARVSLLRPMYAIVARRTREVATLRALGFSRGSVLAAFVLEGLMLALVGGALGCLLSLVMNLVTASTSVGAAEISFAFRVAPADLGYGLLFAIVMGVVGSLLPALSAARLPIIAALRQV